MEIRAFSGAELKPAHWDAFWDFYQDTGARTWGTPYLTREAFDSLSLEHPRLVPSRDHPPNPDERHPRIAARSFEGANE